jgi:hypothetical protein
MRARKGKHLPSMFGGRGLTQYEDATVSTAKDLTGAPVPHLDLRAMRQTPGGKVLITDQFGQVQAGTPVYGDQGQQVAPRAGGEPGGRLTPPYPYADPAIPPENITQR